MSKQGKRNNKRNPIEEFLEDLPPEEAINKEIGRQLKYE